MRAFHIGTQNPAWLRWGGMGGRPRGGEAGRRVPAQAQPAGAERAVSFQLCALDTEREPSRAAEGVHHVQAESDAADAHAGARGVGR